MIKNITLLLRPEEAAHEHTWQQKAARQAGISISDVTHWKVIKRSIDARQRNVQIRLVIDAYINETPGKQILQPDLRDVKNSPPVIIIGCGPAGLFAALRLIEKGLKPVIIERGKNVKDRRRDLAKLNRDHVVNPDSNYCFGEGGAGTYSDGKLYTRAGKRGDVNGILDLFISFGADESVGFDAHPHIGTNKLPGIISAMSEAVTACGGEILFNHRFHSFDLDGKKIKGVHCKTISGSDVRIKGNAVILATGHSAADIFEYLDNENIAISAKPFALGVRIEHPQQLIDSIQYHCNDRGPYLPPSAYSLSAQHNGRGIYSFCMCPGGIIAPAATSPGSVVVNGWSPSKRNNPFANSGIVVSVGEEDFAPFKNSGNLRALRYQQSVEKKAFHAARENLSAPAQRLVDFIDGKFSSTLPPCSYIPGINPVMLGDVLTPVVETALKAGFKEFSKKMKGFLTNEAVLVAPESRTSSPVKIPRDKETLMHPQIEGFFPCGEGAGYAGGIMSAAIDGQNVATAVAGYFHHSKRT